MKNKNKIIPIFLFSIIFSVFLISSVSALLVASPTLQSPDADENIKGTYNINGNFADNSGHNVTQAVFYYRTIGGSWTSIATVTNTSATQTSFNTSWASTGIVDNNGIDFNITLRNSTVVFDSDVSLAVRLDNGVPAATLAASSLATTVKIYASQTGTFTLAIDADSSIGVDNCTIYFQTGTSNFTDAASNACSATTYLPSMFGLSEGYKSYTIEAMDGNGNKTNSSSRQILIYPGDGASAGAGSGGGVSPGATVTIEPGVPSQEVEQPSAPSEGEKGKGLANLGQKVSDVFKKIVDFFRNIFTKKS